MPKRSILVVDDDPIIRKFVQANLEARDYETLMAVDGNEALQVVERELPDLVILDIMMPNTDGFEVCRRLREWSGTPIIMVSARRDLYDKVECLELGADDYLTKPFGVEELLARVKAVLRRTEAAAAPSGQTSFKCDNLHLDFIDRRVHVSGCKVELTPTEYNLLKELVLNANKVLTHDQLLGMVWGTDYTREREYLRVFINRIRKN